MTMNRIRAVCLGFCVVLAGSSSRAATIGDSVVQRPQFDSGNGQVFIYLGHFPSPGEQVASWSFYSDSSASTFCCGNPPSGQRITPLLFDQTSPGVFDVVGIGTTRTNLLTGVQSFSFGLAGGTDIVTASTVFGWKDGAPVGDYLYGVVDMSSDPGRLTYAVLDNNFPVDITLGQSYSGSSLPDRAYSIQFTTAPEPAEVLPTALAIFGIAVFISTRPKRRV